MVSLEWDGRIVFSLHAPGAARVEVVGAFDGFVEQVLEMERDAGGTWRVEVAPGPGSYLFRYRLDGAEWVVDAEAHGIADGADGQPRSRVWCPPLRLDPDSIAA